MLRRFRACLSRPITSLRVSSLSSSRSSSTTIPAVGKTATSVVCGRTHSSTFSERCWCLHVITLTIAQQGLFRTSRIVLAPAKSVKSSSPSSAANRTNNKASIATKTQPRMTKQKQTAGRKKHGSNSTTTSAKQRQQSKKPKMTSSRTVSSSTERTSKVVGKVICRSRGRSAESLVGMANSQKRNGRLSSSSPRTVAAHVASTRTKSVNHHAPTTHALNTQTRKQRSPLPLSRSSSSAQTRKGRFLTRWRQLSLRDRRRIVSRIIAKRSFPNASHLKSVITPAAERWLVETGQVARDNVVSVVPPDAADATMAVDADSSRALLDSSSNARSKDKDAFDQDDDDGEEDEHLLLSSQTTDAQQQPIINQEELMERDARIAMRMLMGQHFRVQGRPLSEENELRRRKLENLNRPLLERDYMKRANAEAHMAARWQIHPTHEQRQQLNPGSSSDGIDYASSSTSAGSYYTPEYANERGQVGSSVDGRGDDVGDAAWRKREDILARGGGEERRDDDMQQQQDSLRLNPHLRQRRYDAYGYDPSVALYEVNDDDDEDGGGAALGDRGGLFIASPSTASHHRVTDDGSVLSSPPPPSSPYRRHPDGL